MPNPPESEPPKPKESPKAEKGASAKSGKDAEIEKAKEIIKKVTSRDEAIRLKAIEDLRHPPLEDLKAAKEVLKTVPMDKIDKIDWLLKSADDVLYSPEVALFAERIAQAGELKDDPRWLLAKTVELAYSVRSDTPEARREINSAIMKVGGRLRELVQNQPFEGIEATTFDEAMYGSSPLVPSEANIFKEEKPEEETVTDPELIRLLREINRKIRTDPEYLKNPKNLENDIKDLQQKAGERKVPENQIREAVMSLRDREKKIQQIEKQNIDYKIVNYKDIKDNIPETDRPKEGEKDYRNDPFIFRRDYFSSDDIDLLKKGPNGQREFFFKFISEIYTMGKTFDKADLPEVMKFDAFKDFIKWMYPKNTHYYLQYYEVIMKDIPKHYQMIKNLLFTPGDITEKLKNLRYLSGADLDLYVKSIDYGNYAVSLYDETVRDVLSERRIKYEKARVHLKDQGAIKDYRDFVQRREKKEKVLSASEQLKFQQLSQEVDDLGYGVMLEDKDVQNYTELDLEVNNMSHELDGLLLKQEKIRKGEDEAKALTDWEAERMKILNREIDYKRNRMRIIKSDEDLHKVQDEDKGLSPIDIEVKRRLRMVLKNRFPEKEVSEWELNFSVWAARQWHMGTSHLVSTAASMAIRPAFELKDIFPEVNTGKYIMKSAFLEDIQRAFNPDMFFDRFTMAGKVGTVFRAQLDRSLLEAKGYKFEHDPKYRGFEDEKKLDPVVRETKEFIRQVEAETGIPFTESIVQGFLKTGGNFDGTTWRAEIGALEQMRDKYLDMQERGELPAKAQLDNQALGLQFAMAKPEERVKIIEKMMQREPLLIIQMMGREMDAIFERYGLTTLEDRFKFRNALSVAQTHSWDYSGQQGKNRWLAFQDMDLSNNKAQFDELAKPYFRKSDFTEAQADRFFSLLKDVREVKDKRAGAWAKNGFPFTITLADLDWKDSEMIRMGTLAMDRRARDMGAQANVMKLSNELMNNPMLLCNKDPKKTLEKIKEIRDAMVAYASPEDSDKAAYEYTKAWLNFNRNRLIHNDWKPPGFFENPVKWAKSFVTEGIPQAPKTLLPWIPLIPIQSLMKYGAEVDTHNGLISQVARLKIGKWEVFGEAGKKVAHGMEEIPKKIAQNVSYAVRYTGTHGNAFEEKEIDEILNEMLQMGMFVEKEGLYHTLRREMKASFGFQVLRLIRRYWWIAPFAAALMGAKEGMEEEKKRSGGGGH